MITFFLPIDGMNFCSSDSIPEVDFPSENGVKCLHCSVIITHIGLSDQREERNYPCMMSKANGHFTEHTERIFQNQLKNISEIKF